MLRSSLYTSILLFLNVKVSVAKKDLPVVIWHGMGDSCCNHDSIGKIVKQIHQFSPKTFVHSIMIGENKSSDRKAGFFGNANSEVEYVFRNLSSIPELSKGFNAIGFSQGGLFLRAYIERYNNPPVKKLITMGSPHSGISDPPGCDDSRDSWNCRLMRSIIRGGAYSAYIRDHVIQAQYIRDQMNYDTYLKYNIFLPDINNEKTIKNQTYKKNLSQLDFFAMIRFEQDHTLVPRNSSWFGSFEIGSQNKEIILEDQDIYKEDWIGLKALDAQGKLLFLSCPGEHMQFTAEYFSSEVLPLILHPRNPRKTGPRQMYGSKKQRQTVF
ncbi:hypothetical protein DSO57_1025224 [Entomophthora muscae]|uniref:Uncharacterized protein n=1 Tax=Entomophthora muscae TaxID=34485 RepID=A0ACC2RTE7_9FUNG|nr:hypothetical protein DSO57_1025224 [Entomophthora muscae]